MDSFKYLVNSFVWLIWSPRKLFLLVVAAQGYSDILIKVNATIRCGLG